MVNELRIDMLFPECLSVFRIQAPIEGKIAQNNTGTPLPIFQFGFLATLD